MGFGATIPVFPGTTSDLFIVVVVDGLPSGVSVSSEAPGGSDFPNHLLISSFPFLVNPKKMVAPTAWVIY